MRGSALVVGLAAALSAASCSQLGLPEQGFATRYLGGTIGPYLHETVQTSSSFDGRSLRPESASGGTASQPIASNVAGGGRDACSEAARQRAEDAADQGFDDDTQKVVFDGTFANCAAWRARH